MIKKFLFVSLVIVALASCKKNNSDSVQAKAKFNGVYTELNFVSGAQLSSDGKSITIVATGGNVNLPYPTLALTVSDNAGITPGKTYTAFPDLDASASYIESSGADAYHSGDDFTIKITSMTATTIKGIFSGQIENSSSDILTVTEGTFYMNYQ